MDRFVKTIDGNSMNSYQPEFFSYAVLLGFAIAAVMARRQIMQVFRDMAIDLGAFALRSGRSYRKSVERRAKVLDGSKHQ